MNSSLNFLNLPVIRIQPVLARAGEPSIPPEELRRSLPEGSELLPLITIRDLEHWRHAISQLSPQVDAIALLSNPCYPTEIWNEDPAPLRQRGLPVVFWPLIQYDEPDFWKWSCTDMLRSCGVTVELPENLRAARAWVRALALRKFLRNAKIAVFGKQNFPWNGRTAFGGIHDALGTQIAVLPCSDAEERRKTIAPAAIQEVRQNRLNDCLIGSVRPAELDQAIAWYLSARELLAEQQAFAFGVNCFGDLIPGGSRWVPCLAQQLLRQDGFITACDGDFCAILSLAIAQKMLSRPGMMSNLYPLTYRGALTGHFGSPLDCGSRWSARPRENLARLAHCGFIGIVPPEMTPTGKVRLTDWGGTYEIKRDGRGCGIDGDLIPGETITVIELKFDGQTLLLTRGTVLESTRHAGMPHCESSALLEFEDLPAFVRQISREHTAVIYGDGLAELQIAARVLGLTPVVITANR